VDQQKSMSGHAPGPDPDPDPDPQPIAPLQPALEDCCTSGCVYCIFDIYEEKLERYRLALAEWQQRHPADRA
jgi:hypothetical protein